jgi:hypothetical protein
MNVSIMIPLHNKARHIRRALDSVVLPANPDRFCRLRELLISLEVEQRVFATYDELLTD